MMRSAIFAGEFNLLCWLIFTAEDITGAPNVAIHYVETAEIVPPPHQLEELYLALKSHNQRKKLCAIMFDKMFKSSQFPLGTSSSTPTIFDRQQSVASSPASFSYVPKAHVYKFDNEEEWLSVHCTAFPPFYVSHEMVNEKKHYWHIWVQRPAMERYEFRLETFYNVSDNLDLNNTERLPSKTHYFYRLNTLQRWYLCSEARRVINCVDEKIVYNTQPEEPHIHRFRYSNGWSEQYLNFRCYGMPMIMLRTGDQKKIETNVIYIALLQNDREVEDEGLDDSDISLDIEE